MNDEHIFALVKAIDGAYLDAIQILALYAVFHDHVGHTYILMSTLLGRDCARFLRIPKNLPTIFAVDAFGSDGAAIGVCWLVPQVANGAREA
jgi:hypothetical protein